MSRSARHHVSAAGLTLAALAFASAVAAQEPSQPTASSETFGSWVLTCVDDGKATACEMNQNIADSTGKPVMQLQVGLFNQPAPNYAMLARFPVDVVATAPITWSAGETLVPLTLRACRGAVCAADGPLPEDVVSALVAADPQVVTHFSLTRADGTQVAVPLSLTGFAEAWSAMIDRSS